MNALCKARSRGQGAMGVPTSVEVHGGDLGVNVHDKGYTQGGGIKGRRASVHISDQSPCSHPELCMRAFVVALREGDAVWGCRGKGRDGMGWVQVL